MQQLPMFDAVEIPLTQGYVALVDPCDADLLQYKWYAHKHPHKATPYAIRKVGPRTANRRISMHRVILERAIGRPLSSQEEPDHINGNGCDNRRSNLRVANYAQNRQNMPRRIDNTSGYKGVSWDKERQKWVATIKAGGKRRIYKRFDTIEEAHAAYVEAALKYHGEFARTE